MIVKETEALSNIIKSNADTICTQTLEKLVSLIEDKRTSRISYTDERRRFEDEIKKVQSSMCLVLAYKYLSFVAIIIIYKCL